MKSLGVSVAKLHCGTWFDLSQGEADAWHSVLFTTYQLLEKRDAQGNITPKELYELAHQAGCPMPIEFLYIERLRLLIHMLTVFDKYVIAAVLHNFRVAGPHSWLYGAKKCVKWAQTQIGRECIPDELLNLETWDTWKDFQDAATELRMALKKVEKAHQLRLETYCVCSSNRGNSKQPSSRRWDGKKQNNHMRVVRTLV